MKKAFVLLFLVLWPFSGAAPQASKGPKQTLFAKVNLHVDWKIHGENSVETRHGVMNLAMSGTLNLNKSLTGPVDKGRFSPILTYTLQGGTFSYNFKDDVDLDKPAECSNPQRAMQKSGSMSADSGGQPVTLMVHYQSGLAENLAKLPIAPPPEAVGAMIDYYEFFIQIPAQRSEGKSKVYSSEKKRCVEIDQSDPLFDGGIEIAWKMGSGGKMSGSKSWSSPGQSNTFSVRVSNLPATFKKREAVPKPGTKNSTNYALSWDFDAAPAAQIEHETGGYWFDITGIDQEVVVGQKIHLKGLVAPRTMDPGSGKWTIGNDNTVKPIKKFEADHSQGRVIRLNSGDLSQPETTFFFTREGESEVTFKTQAGGQETTATVKFKVKKPDFDLVVTAAQSNTYGPLKVGASNKGFDCCGGGSSPESEAASKYCQDLAKDIAAATDPSWKKKLQDKYDAECGSQLVGLQYDGITFEAVPKDGTPGEIQFVQLIRAATYRTEPDRGGWSREVEIEGLDGCYPYPLNRPSGTFDAPGFTRPIYLFARSYTMYLMFRPKGDGNEWVPLKVYYWDWQGGLICDETGCRENKGDAVFPASGNGTDADEYPEWDHCSNPGR